MGDLGAVVVVVALVALAAVAAFAIAAVVFGRADLTPPRGRNEPLSLPTGPLTAADLDHLKIASALRGYRMSEVDHLLARIRQQLPPGEPVSGEPRDAPPRTPGQEGTSALEPPVT